MNLHVSPKAIFSFGLLALIFNFVLRFGIHKADVADFVLGLAVALMIGGLAMMGKGRRTGSA